MHPSRRAKILEGLRGYVAARRADFKLQIAVFRFHEAGGTYSRLQIAKAKTAQIMQFGRLQKAKMLTWQNSARQTFSSQECKFQISKLAPPGLAKAECRMQNADWTSSRILRGLLQIAKFRLHMRKTQKSNAVKHNSDC